MGHLEVIDPATVSSSTRELGGTPLLLVSPVGFAHGWAPVNIMRLQAHAETAGARARTLSLCLRFSRMLAREQPEFADYDTEMGEWGSSFHELYFGAKYFGHADPGALIRAAVADSMSGADIFRAAPWEPSRSPSSTLVDLRVRDILRLCQLIEEYSLAELEAELEAHPPAVVGFSVGAQQLTTAAFLTRAVRERAPSSTIVFGGPAILARTAPRYRELLTEVDYFVHGDGELALTTILAGVAGNAKVRMKGVLSRTSPSSDVSAPVPRLPAAELAPLRYEEDGFCFADVPLTTWFGRGCSWGKCSFCAIPTEQRQLDNRPVEALVEELLALHRRHGTSRFRFGDWEVNGAREDLMRFCGALIERRCDFHFWAEVNARNMDRELMARMKAAGFVSLQVGLEAFCDSLLRKLRKPATLVDNVACMKYAHEVGVELFSNILFNAPGETRDDILASARTIASLRHLMGPPVSLAVIEFMMEVDADAHANAKTADLGESYAFERRCFPDEIEAPFFLRGRSTEAARLWANIQREVEACASGAYTMYHRREGTSLVIEDQRGRDDARTHVLTGFEAEFYTALAEVCSVQDLSRRWPEVAPAVIGSLLEELDERRLIVRSGRRTIGLSIPDPEV